MAKIQSLVPSLKLAQHRSEHCRRSWACRWPGCCLQECPHSWGGMKAVFSTRSPTVRLLRLQIKLGLKSGTPDGIVAVAHEHPLRSMRSWCPMPSQAALGLEAGLASEDVLQTVDGCGLDAVLAGHALSSRASVWTPCGGAELVYAICMLACEPMLGGCLQLPQPCAEPGVPPGTSTKQVAGDHTGDRAGGSSECRVEAQSSPC